MRRALTHRTSDNDLTPFSRLKSARRGTLSMVGLALAGSLAFAVSGGASGASGKMHHAKKPSGALAQIEKTHELSIAISAFAPQDFQNSKGTWVGYDPAILRKFAKTLGAKLKVDAVPFASAVEAVKTHRDDLTIDIYYNKTRAKAIGFSRPMLNYSDGVAVNASQPQVKRDTVQNLKGKSIAVTTGSAEVAEANQVPGAHVTQFNSTEETFLALSQQRVAADFQPAVDIAYAKHKNPSLDIKLIGSVPHAIAPPVVSLRGYYGLPKGAYGHDLKLKLDAFLKKITCNGTEQKILDHYGMTQPIYLKGLCKAPNNVH